MVYQIPQVKTFRTESQGEKYLSFGFDNPECHERSAVAPIPGLCGQKYRLQKALRLRGYGEIKQIFGHNLLNSQNFKNLKGAVVESHLSSAMTWCYLSQSAMTISQQLIKKLHFFLDINTSFTIHSTQMYSLQQNQDVQNP